MGRGPGAVGARKKKTGEGANRVDQKRCESGINCGPRGKGNERLNGWGGCKPEVASPLRTKRDQPASASIRTQMAQNESGGEGDLPTVGDQGELLWWGSRLNTGEGVPSTRKKERGAKEHTPRRGCTVKIQCP